MAPPVAIVTGGSSGIGLAVTKHCLHLNWNVVIADLNPPKEQLEGTKFVKTDISSWDQQASLFQQAYEWHGRLDFCALNAGMDDRDDIFNSISSDSTKPPRQPNMKLFDVNLYGTYYGCKLAAHYMSLDSSAAGKAKCGGKIVITASAAGIYPLPSVPQYAASKHALVGLVRSLAPAASVVNIRIGAVCPALVATGLAPAGLMDSFSQDQVTPMSTIIRCFDAFASFADVGKEDWVDTGRTGEVVEGNLGDLIWHEAPSRPASSSYMDKKGLEDWANAYRERNRNFAMQDWMAQK